MAVALTFFFLFFFWSSWGRGCHTPRCHTPSSPGCHCSASKRDEHKIFIMWEGWAYTHERLSTGGEGGGAGWSEEKERGQDEGGGAW